MPPKSIKPEYMLNAAKYDRILPAFPYVPEMFMQMIYLIKEYAEKKGEAEILEYGFGTGLFTLKIAQMKNAVITAVDPSPQFYPQARKRLNKFKNINLLQKDAVNYKHTHPVEIIVTTFTYHHIPDDQKQKFIQSAANNLKPGGILFIGDEFIPPFKNQTEKIKAIKKLYACFAEYFEQANAPQEAIDVWQESLKESLQGVEEFKTSFEVLKKHLAQARLKLLEVIPIYPKDPEEEMGCKIIIATK